MNRVNELIKEYCPDGVEIRCLEDCCNLLDKKRKPKQLVKLENIHIMELMEFKIMWQIIFLMVHLF